MKQVLIFVFLLLGFLVFLPMFSSTGTDDIMLFKINEGYLKDAYELVSQSKGDFVDSFSKVISVASDLKEYKSTKDQVKKTNIPESSIADLKKIFTCVLSSMVGNYEYKTVTENEVEAEAFEYNTDGTPKLDKDGKQVRNKTTTKIKTETWNQTWGVKCRYPFAEGYNISAGDDYGNERTYGGARTHEGNDLVCSKGTPIINIETGYLKRIGWSDFGGWNVIIESLDGNRRYYYAHMMKFANYTTLNTKIEAGQVIGFVGDSGYGSEGTTGQFIAHLHLQIEVKYDDSTKLNINPYSILKFLESNKVKVSDVNGDSNLECDPNSEIKINQSSNIQK